MSLGGYFVFVGRILCTQLSNHLDMRTSRNNLNGSVLLKSWGVGISLFKYLSLNNYNKPLLIIR